MAARRTHPATARTPADGRYCGVAYVRVSTSDQANTSFDADGFSIQAQREYCQRKAAELGVELVAEYVDRGTSARTADRPGLQAMLARVKDDTAIQYVLVHKLDRLARNRADDIQIGLLLAKNGVRLVSCTETFDDTPSGQLVRGIMGDINEYFSANLGLEVLKGMRKKLELGGTPYLAPLGYVNARHKIVELGKDVGVVTVHETFGPLVTACFQRYDTGRYALDDMAAYANEQGLRMPANKRYPERPLHPQSMHRLLRNRYYIGRVMFDGVEYAGGHPPLIDEATFARVQALLTARNLRKDKYYQRPHHLKGTIYCARCGRRLGITAPTKRRSGVTYPYFYCLGRQTDKNNCPQGYLPVGDIEDAVGAYLAQVRLPAARVTALRQAILQTFARDQTRSLDEVEAQRQRISELEQRRRKAKAAYYAGVLDLAEFRADQERYRQSLQAAEAVIAQAGVAMDSFAEALDAAFALTENPQMLYEALPEPLKPTFVRAVFDKLWVLDGAVVGGELTAPFAELLTADAQLAWTGPQPKNDGARATDTGEPDTYYRQREPGTALLRSLADSWERPCIERPRGPLPVDKLSTHQKTLGHQRTKGSKFFHLVHLAGFNLNSELLR